MLTPMVVEYDLADRVERAVDIDALRFVASDKIGLERPVVGDTLLGNDPTDAAVRDEHRRCARFPRPGDEFGIEGLTRC
jgi:hypothetical protein